MVLERLGEDVLRHTQFPKDEVAPTKKPVLPFFHNFEQFVEDTKCPHVSYWRLYQAAIGHLLLLGKITKLDDEQAIPDDFWIWRWLRLEFEPTP